MLGLLMSHPVDAVVGCVWWMKSTIIFLVLLGFFPLTHIVIFSALISNIYWCSIVSHQQILMVRHVAQAKIIGAAFAAPVSTPMILGWYWYQLKVVQRFPFHAELERKNFKESSCKNVLGQFGNNLVQVVLG